MTEDRADVVIIGAGCVGIAAALYLKELDPAVGVTVVEPDYSYESAATGKGTGGVRQLFTRPENILLSQVTLDVIDDWQNWASVCGEPAPELGWRQNGYMFVVAEKDVPELEANFTTQTKHGVDAEWIDRQGLAERFPEIISSDMAAAVLSPRDGWLNPTVFFSVLQAKARATDVGFLTDRVVSLEAKGSLVRTATLESGRVLHAEKFINAAGVDAPAIARHLGVDLPVEPMRRHEHYVQTGEDVSHLPFFKDVHGLAVHAYRDGISVGLVDFDHPGGANFAIDPADYTQRVAPALDERFCGLGGLTLRESWTGLYDQNRFDGNMILGNAPGTANNLYTACGFSGHGFMHALGVGRGLAELILHGEYRALDLSRMGYERILTGERYGEEGVR